MIILLVNFYSIDIVINGEVHYHGNSKSEFMA
jgi:hypothetical protein